MPVDRPVAGLLVRAMATLAQPIRIRRMQRLVMLEAHSLPHHRALAGQSEARTKSHLHCRRTTEEVGCRCCSTCACADPRRQCMIFPGYAYRLCPRTEELNEAW